MISIPASATVEMLFFRKMRRKPAAEDAGGAAGLESRQDAFIIVALLRQTRDSAVGKEAQDVEDMAQLMDMRLP